ncbi:MAG: hypothetical protein OHK0022_22950 [Roseiflexaceae bacterium]
MHAIEFQARIRNGVIEIPESYRSHLGEIVRVIILTPERPQGTGIIARLLEHPIYDPTFTPLSRDEIYGDRTEK